MEFPVFNPHEIALFLLILVRTSVLVFFAPIFGSDLVPAQAKAALALVLSLILTPVVKFQGAELPTDTVALVPLMLVELFMGLSISILIRLILEGVQLAGQYVGYQMGFAIVNVIDPQTGAQSSVISEFAYILALIVFLSVDGHHIILKALVESFELVPPGRLALNPAIMGEVIRGVTQMFIIAIKIGAPALAVLFFTQVSMGIVAKAAPQVNILFVGMPLYIIVGLVVFGLSFTFFIPLISRAVGYVNAAVMNVLRAM